MLISILLHRRIVTCPAPGGSPGSRLLLFPGQLADRGRAKDQRHPDQGTGCDGLPKDQRRAQHRHHRVDVAHHGHALAAEMLHGAEIEQVFRQTDGRREQAYLHQ